MSKDTGPRGTQIGIESKKGEPPGTDDMMIRKCSIRSADQMSLSQKGGRRYKAVSREKKGAQGEFNVRIVRILFAVFSRNVTSIPENNVIISTVITINRVFMQIFPNFA